MVVSYGLFCIPGTIGFFACLYFMRTIYAAAVTCDATPHSPVSPLSHEALVGLNDNDETAAPKGSISAMSVQPEGLDEASADISGDESTVLMGKVSMTAEDEVLEDDISWQDHHAKPPEVVHTS